jgi:hypothetical protein
MQHEQKRELPLTKAFTIAIQCFVSHNPLTIVSSLLLYLYFFKALFYRSAALYCKHSTTSMEDLNNNNEENNHIYVRYFDGPSQEPQTQIGQDAAMTMIKESLAAISQNFPNEHKQGKWTLDLMEQSGLECRERLDCWIDQVNQAQWIFGNLPHWIEAARDEVVSVSEDAQTALDREVSLSYK